MHHMLEGPAPATLFAPVLQSPRWLAKTLEETKQGVEWMEILASLCPSSQRGGLRALMEPLDATLTLTALPLLDILDSLEKVGHHEE
jgi:hypothetical protein